MGALNLLPLQAFLALQKVLAVAFRARDPVFASFQQAGQVRVIWELRGCMPQG